MRLLKHRFTRFYLVFFVILVMAIGGSVAAFADSGTGATVAITGGSLSEQGPTSVSATPVTLTGDDQTTTYSMGLTVNDPRGNGSGWNLTITSTTFTSGSNTLDTVASSILTSPAVVCSGTGSHCTNPTNGITYPVGVPAGAPAPTAVKFFNAATSSGLGKFTITPTITVSIPGNTYAGTYTSTVSVAVVTGP
jgi:hypothetical protein